MFFQIMLINEKQIDVQTRHFNTHLMLQGIAGNSYWFPEFRPSRYISLHMLFDLFVILYNSRVCFNVTGSFPTFLVAIRLLNVICGDTEHCCNSSSVAEERRPYRTFQFTNFRVKFGKHGSCWYMRVRCISRIKWFSAYCDGGKQFKQLRAFRKYRLHKFPVGKH
jgi:hypothetical protein